MDLVEIRKKAKSRKNRKGKAEEKPQKEAHEKGAEDQTPVAPAAGDEQYGSETGTAPESEGSLPSRHQDDVPAGIQSLEDVFLSQQEEDKDEEEEQLQLLTFLLGGEEYALNIMDIKEIIRPRETTEVPRTPDYILGIFSLRGTIIPVIDVGLRLGLKPGERGPQNRIVVVRNRDHLFGLHVDSVVQVLDIPIDRIEPPPEILGGVEGEFLQGIGRIDDRLIILLNLKRILELDAVTAAVPVETSSGKDKSHR